MTSPGRDLTLERLARLTEAGADLAESHAAHGRQLLAMLESMTIRLALVDSRLVSADARLSALYAGQNAQTLALRRIADTQSEHSTRFDAIAGKLDAIGERLNAILGRISK